jgi:maleate cis-trans isomerase
MGWTNPLSELPCQGIVMNPPQHRSAYSSRGKIGLIVPPTNTVNEAEWARMMPGGVTFHTVRMPIHIHVVSEADRRTLIRDIAAKAIELTAAGVDVVAYACTAGSMVLPPRSLPEAVSEIAKVAVITTAAAIVEALRFLGAKTVSVATPYHEALNAHEREFLTAAGFGVRAIKGLGIGANGPADYPLIAQTPIDSVFQHAKSTFVPGSDALLISCTDFPTLPLIDRLERELGVPVVTSNQATLWDVLRAIGIAEPLARGGMLLSSEPLRRAQSNG